MTFNVHATYRDGLIHPLHPLNLPEGAELELTVEAAVTHATGTSDRDSTPARMVLNRQRVSRFDRQLCLEYGDIPGTVPI